MQLCNFLCVLVLSVLFSSDFVVFSSAAVPCPVRAVPVFTSEVERGFKCVCVRGFYGTNCRLKAGNTSQHVVMNGKWVNNNTAAVSWLGEYGTKFHLTLRKIWYKDGNMFHSKWQQAVIKAYKIVVNSSNAQAALLGPNSGREGTTLTEFGVPANYTTQLRLTHFYNYEINLAILTSSGDVERSVSLFLDASNYSDFENISTNNNEEVNCPWYKCPGRFFHIKDILADLGKSCFIHGVIFAVALTFFGTLFIGTLICVIVRLCKRTHNKKPTTEPGQKSGTEDSDGQSVGKKENIEAEDSVYPRSFVMIEMPDIDSSQTTEKLQEDFQTKASDGQSVDKKENIETEDSVSVRSFVIEMPDIDSSPTTEKRQEDFQAKVSDGQSVGKKENIETEDRVSVRSFVIEMPDIDSFPTTENDFQEDFQPVYITIEDIMTHIKPSSVNWTDEESISESGSSLTTSSLGELPTAEA